MPQDVRDRLELVKQDVYDIVPLEPSVLGQPPFKIFSIYWARLLLDEFYESLPEGHTHMKERLLYIKAELFDMETFSLRAKLLGDET